MNYDISHPSQFLVPENISHSTSQCTPSSAGPSCPLAHSRRDLVWNVTEEKL